MPQFISVGGKWRPKKEQVSIKNTFGKTLKSKYIIGPDGKHSCEEGQIFIYTGPDREAIKMLKEENVEYFGRDFKNDPEFLQATRNMGFNSPEEYLTHIGFDEEKETEKQAKEAEIINKHELPKEAEEVAYLAGGKDTSGNKNDFIGGFGSERARPASEAKTVKKI